MANPRGATLEQKILGDRPRHTEILEGKPRQLALIKGLNWHAFYFDAKRDLPLFEKFIKQHAGINAADIKYIRAAAPSRLAPTIVSLVKMIVDGWIPTDAEQSKIVDHVNDLIAHGKTLVSSSDEPDAVKPTAVEIPRAIALRPQIMSFLQAFDVEEESWFVKRRVPVADSLEEFKTLVFDAKMTSSEYLEAVSFFEKRLSEYKEAYAKTDPDLTEGYEEFGLRLLGVAVRRIGMYIESLSEAHEKTRVVKKARKISNPKIPRKSKTPAADAQIKNLKFLPASAEYNVSSIDPKKVIGAKVLVTFNTKYRTATIFRSSTPDGFSFKGTTLLGFDETSSKTRGIRKPQDFIPILKGKSFLSVEKAWKDLTTVERAAKGRINEDTLLLRII